MTADLGGAREGACGDKILERGPPDSEIFGGFADFHETGASVNGIGHLRPPPPGLTPVGWRPLCAGLHDAAAIDPHSSSRGRSDAVAYELHGLRHPDCAVAAGSFRYSWRTFWSPAL